MNDFLQLVASRQSDRAYDMTRAVEPEKLERILAAACLQCTTVEVRGSYGTGAVCQGGQGCCRIGDEQVCQGCSRSYSGGGGVHECHFLSGCKNQG